MEGLLKLGYCLRTIGYYFPYCFLEIFVGEDKVVMGGSPSPPTRENPVV